MNFESMQELAYKKEKISIGVPEMESGKTGRRTLGDIHKSYKLEPSHGEVRSVFLKVVSPPAVTLIKNPRVG